MNATKIQQSLDFSNPTLRIAHKLEKTDFQKFYQGWNSFYKMEAYDDELVFSLPSCNLVSGAILEASKRIDDLGLPLVVLPTGKCSTTFLIRRK